MTSKEQFPPQNSDMIQLCKSWLANIGQFIRSIMRKQIYNIQLFVIAMIQCSAEIVIICVECQRVIIISFVTPKSVHYDQVRLMKGRNYVKSWRLGALKNNMNFLRLHFSRIHFSEIRFSSLHFSGFCFNFGFDVDFCIVVE